MKKRNQIDVLKYIARKIEPDTQYQVKDIIEIMSTSSFRFKYGNASAFLAKARHDGYFIKHGNQRGPISMPKSTHEVLLGNNTVKKEIQKGAEPSFLDFTETLYAEFGTSPIYRSDMYKKMASSIYTVTQETLKTYLDVAVRQGVIAVSENGRMHFDELIAECYLSDNAEGFIDEVRASKSQRSIRLKGITKTIFLLNQGGPISSEEAFTKLRYSAFKLTREEYAKYLEDAMAANIIKVHNKTIHFLTADLPGISAEQKESFKKRTASQDSIQNESVIEPLSKEDEQLFVQYIEFALHRIKPLDRITWGHFYSLIPDLPDSKLESFARRMLALGMLHESKHGRISFDEHSILSYVDANIEKDTDVSIVAEVEVVKPTQVKKPLPKPEPEQSSSETSALTGFEEDKFLRLINPFFKDLSIGSSSVIMNFDERGNRHITQGDIDFMKMFSMNERIASTVMASTLTIDISNFMVYLERILDLTPYGYIYEFVKKYDYYKQMKSEKEVPTTEVTPSSEQLTSETVLSQVDTETEEAEVIEEKEPVKEEVPVATPHPLNEVSSKTLSNAYLRASVSVPLENSLIQISKTPISKIETVDDFTKVRSIIDQLQGILDNI